MSLKKRLLIKSNFYLITDENTKKAASSLTAGVNIVQLRIEKQSDSLFFKKALSLRKVTQDLKKILIINNRPDIALASGADGVHLGQNDLPLTEARKLLGAKKIIGISTHSLKEAKDAVLSGADYIGIGPVFTTKTKPDYKKLSLETIKKIIDFINIPYFVIGGINLNNLPILLKNNINRVAVFSSIIKRPNPYYKTKRMIKKLNDDFNRKI